jgi:hypothetical protein
LFEADHSAFFRRIPAGDPPVYVPVIQNSIYQFDFLVENILLCHKKYFQLLLLLNCYRNSCRRPAFCLRGRALAIFLPDKLAWPAKFRVALCCWAYVFRLSV